MDVLKQFKHIKKEIDRMQSVSGTNQFYDYEKQVKGHIKLLLCEDFLQLNKAQIVELLCWCNTYRPIEPWQVLLKVSMRADGRKVQDEKPE